MIIGRIKELALLRGLMKEDYSQFVAVYGRRRVGKTFLGKRLRDNVLMRISL